MTALFDINTISSHLEAVSSQLTSFTSGAEEEVHYNKEQALNSFKNFYNEAYKIKDEFIANYLNRIDEAERTGDKRIQRHAYTALDNFWKYFLFLGRVIDKIESKPECEFITESDLASCILD